MFGLLNGLERLVSLEPENVLDWFPPPRLHFIKKYFKVHLSPEKQLPQKNISSLPSDLAFLFKVSSVWLKSFSFSAVVFAEERQLVSLWFLLSIIN